MSGSKNISISESAFEISDKEIGLGHKPFVIAEMSGNHNQSLEKAMQIVEAAAEARVDAVKLQTYTPDTITLDIKENEFFINDDRSLWKGNSLHELYQKAHTPWEWHEPLMRRADELGIVCFSTPFDETAVDFLEDLNVPIYKVASFENNHLPLIRKIASTGKPIIISTGMATISGIDEAVRTAFDGGCPHLVLLKCTSSYPANPEHSNILTIPHMRKLYRCEVGISDHTMGVGASIAAVAHGATVIEKHFTLSRSDGGVDSTFSLEPDELKALVVETERAWQSLGDIQYGISESEKQSTIFRRSLYISKSMKTGDKITPANLRIVRPGAGLEPKYYDVFLNKRVNRNVKRGTPVSWEIIS